MSITLEQSPPTSFRPDKRKRSEHDVYAAIHLLLGHQPVRQVAERRREQRYPYPYPVRLTTITSDGAVAPAESVVVLGKHLTEHGLDFYYKQPLAYRRVIATFERNGQDLLHLMMELTWCRFGHHGWYENGGRFLQVLPTLVVPGDGSQSQVA